MIDFCDSSLWRLDKMTMELSSKLTVVLKWNTNPTILYTCQGIRFISRLVGEDSWTLRWSTKEHNVKIILIYNYSQKERSIAKNASEMHAWSSKVRTRVCWSWCKDRYILWPTSFIYEDNRQMECTKEMLQFR